MTKSFGQAAVSSHEIDGKQKYAIEQSKETIANAIDQMNDLRNNTDSTQGQKRHASTAITMLEDAQMRMVKAITWSEQVV